MATTFPKPPGLSREFIIKSVLKMYDDAVVKNRWGELVCRVQFQNGDAKCVSPYFKPTIKEEVQAV